MSKQREEIPRLTLPARRIEVAKAKAITVTDAAGGELVTQSMAQVAVIQREIPRLTELVQTYTDEQLQALAMQSNVYEYVGMRYKMAAIYEEHRRIVERVNAENANIRAKNENRAEGTEATPTIKVETHLDLLAGEWGIELRTIYNDSKLHRIFFVPRPFSGNDDATEEERAEYAESEKTSLFETEQAAEYLGNKQFLTLSLRAKGQEREILLILSKMKEENGGSLTTRGAEKRIKEFLGLNDKAPNPEETSGTGEPTSVSSDIMQHITAITQAAKMVEDSGAPAFVFRLENKQVVASINPPKDDATPRMMVIPTKRGPYILQSGEDWDEEDTEEGTEEAEEDTEVPAPEVPAPTTAPTPAETPAPAPVQEIERVTEEVPIFDEE